MSRRGKRRIAPRLADGSVREPVYNGLPPAIKEGIDAIARFEGRSRSWVIEEIVIDWMVSKKKARRPQYRPRKKNAEPKK